MIVLLIIFWLLGLFLSIKSPTYFVVYFILASTKFLGFIDPSTFIVNGIELGYFGLNLITLIGAFLFIKWYSIPKRSILFLSLISIMLIYGILKPIIDGNSTAGQALIASKDIWFYFLFFYLVLQRKRVLIADIIKIVKWLGLYLSLIYIIGVIYPNFVPHLYFEDEIVRVFYPTYISLALLLFAVEIKVENKNIINNYLLILLLMTGLFLTGYASLTITSALGLIIYKFMFNQQSLFSKSSIIRLTPFLILFILSMILYNEAIYYSVLEQINDIVSRDDTSLSSRIFYNEFRWEAINKQKEFGYGFIHQSSDIMKTINTSDTNRFMERLGVIDSGYVDMLTKFGFIGSAIILMVYFKYTLIGFVKKNRNPLSLAMSIYLAQYFFVNYTWSVFTFAHGIIPGVIALFILLNTKSRISNFNKIKRGVRFEFRRKVTID